MGNRSRLVYSSVAILNQAETLAIDEILPFNATLIQMSLLCGGPPTTPGNVDIYRVTQLPGLLWAILIRQVDPLTEIFPLVCPEQCEFRKNDRIVATYANADDQTCALELIFEEAS